MPGRREGCRAIYAMASSVPPESARAARLYRTARPFAMPGAPTASTNLAGCLAFTRLANCQPVSRMRLDDIPTHGHAAAALPSRQRPGLVR